MSAEHQTGGGGGVAWQRSFGPRNFNTNRQATPAYRTDEVNATRTMVDRVEDRFDIKPTHLIGDTAYGTAAMLGWMVDEKAIEPHVPVWEKAERNDGTFSRTDFEWHGRLVTSEPLPAWLTRRLHRNAGDLH